MQLRFLQSLDIACLGTLGSVRVQSTSIWQTVLASGEQFLFSATFGFSVTSSTEYSFKGSDSSLWIYSTGVFQHIHHCGYHGGFQHIHHLQVATQGMSSLLKSLVRMLTVDVEQFGSSSGLLRSCCRSRNLRLHLCWRLKHSYGL